MLALQQVRLGFCESLPLIESTSLVSSRNWQRTETTETAGGPFGGQSFTTFAVESFLSFQVNRSDTLGDSQQQYVMTTPETASETSALPAASISQKNITLFFWAPLDCLVSFSFPWSLLYTCFHTFISWSCTIRRLPPCTSYVQPSRLLPILKSTVTLGSWYQFFMLLLLSCLLRTKI